MAHATPRFVFLARALACTALAAACAVGCNASAPDPTASDGTFGRRCAPGEEGPDCKSCAAGYQDRDGNGLCAPSCAITSCGAHERCDDASGRAICRCVAGYVRASRVSAEDGGVGGANNGKNRIEEDARNACIFQGGPRDWGFQQDGSAANGWTTDGVAFLVPTAPTDARGGIEPGWVQLPGTSMISQSFEMPSWQDAEPLAMDLTFGCELGGTCQNVKSLTVLFGERGVSIPFATATGGFLQRRICLGDGVFGRRVTLSSVSYANYSRISSGEDGLIDHLRFVPASECPAPGRVLDGTFDDYEGGMSGWHPETHSLDGNTNGTLVEIREGVGTNGGRAGVLIAPKCNAPGLVSVVSVPERMQHPSLRFKLRASHPRVKLEVALAAEPIAIVGATNAREDLSQVEHPRVCLPQWSRGLAHELGVSLHANCGESQPLRTAIVDDFEVVDDPSCGAAAVIDGGFEEMALSSTAAWIKPGYETRSEIGGDEERVVLDPSRAHGGAAYLSLTAFCGAVQRSQAVAVPVSRSTDLGGPAVRFFYRTKDNDLGGSYAHVDGSWKDLPTAPEWTERRQCISPEHAGLFVDVVFSATTNAGGVFGSGDPESPTWSCDAIRHTVDIDDVSVVLDPACPKTYVAPDGISDP